MKDMYILGIETSCDETSVSIVKNGKEEIATVVLSQMNEHANYGGVVPEIASRMHVENITLVVEECLKKARKNRGVERSFKMSIPSEVYDNLEKEFAESEEE